MSKSKIILFVCCTMLFLQLVAQNAESKKIYFQGYSGGMMLHTGYLSGGSVEGNYTEEKLKIQGATFGVGGLLRFHFGKHLRIGGEGYNSTLHYGKNKSYFALGWGGLLIDCQWEINKFTVFLGGTIGGGSVRNITVLQPISPHSIEKNAIYRKYAVMIADPFFGVEYVLTQRIHLIAKTDYIIHLTDKQPNFANGMRIYVGIIFSHAKKNNE